jgi:hypothetical protein
MPTTRLCHYYNTVIFGNAMRGIIYYNHDFYQIKLNLITSLIKCFYLRKSFVSKSLTSFVKPYISYFRFKQEILKQDISVFLERSDLVDNRKYVYRLVILLLNKHIIS